MAQEEPKRLEPTKEVLRELFLKSGNLCAFPGCSHMMMNAHGDFIGQICHIEGVKGERYRAAMTNEERRAFGNLLLLCYAHHVETNDEDIWTVPRLVQIKADHEARFTDPSSIMLQAFVDQTKSVGASAVSNLRHLKQVLGWTESDEEMEQSAADLTAYLSGFSKVPIETRKFLGAVVERLWHMRDTGAVQKPLGGSAALKVQDFMAAHNLSANKVKAGIEALETYGLGGHSYVYGSFGDEDAISVYDLQSGWPLWLSLAEYCERDNISLTVFTEQLDFKRLDE